MTNLHKELRKKFLDKVEADAALQRAFEQITSGKGNYIVAEEYAYQIGTALSEVFQENLSASNLNNTELMRRFAESVLHPLLSEETDMVSAAAVQVQKTLNERANIGLKSLEAPKPTDRISGLVDKVAAAEKYDDVAWVMDEPVKNLAQSVVSETMRTNVEMHGRAGLSPKIVREAESGCCKWCNGLAGEFDYPEIPKVVYRRHERCRCTVEYDPGNGKKQNVHTKQWKNNDERVKIKNRQGQNLLTQSKRRYEPDIVIGRSVGAKAKNYEVMDLSTGEVFRFVEGTRLKNVEVFAGKGVKKPYEKAYKYADRYGGNVDDWQHVKGFGWIETEDGDRYAEVHWSQCEGIGKHDFFVKRWLDD